MTRFNSLLITLSIYCCNLLPSAATEAYIAVERYSKRVLLAANTEAPVFVGRFAQLATVKVAMDWTTATRTSLATAITVPNGITAVNNPLRLVPGDRISMRDAIYSVSMANDEVSSIVIADFVGRHILNRKQKPGNPVSAFVAEMNNLAATLNMRNTKFLSPAGSNAKSTTSDLARLASGVLSTRGYNFYVNQKSRKVTILRYAGTKDKLTLINNNMLLNKQGISGMKAVGNSSAISAEKKPYQQKLANGDSKVTPVQMIIISAGSPNRDTRVSQLITSGWAQYEAWRNSGYMASKERKEFLR